MPKIPGAPRLEIDLPQPELESWAAQTERDGPFGTKRVDDYRAELEAQSGGLKRVKAQLRLGSELVAQVQIEEGLAVLKDALAAARAQHDRVWTQRALEVLAEAEMKAAELNNCVAQHRATSCLVPFSPDAVHRNAELTRAAAGHWRDILQIDPGDRRAAWLLNLASMAAGTSSTVPPRYKMPPSAYGTATGIGHFENAAPRLGLTRSSGAGGVIVEDFDNDGFLDIVFTSYGPTQSMIYYKNNGDGTFTDRTAEAGLSHQIGALSCIQTDYDNDGRIDILVLRGGWLRSWGKVRPSLMHNVGGGRFEDITVRAGLAGTPGPTQAAVWADFDRDGYLDLYLAYEGTDNDIGVAQLFHNNHDGTFTDIAARAGVTNDRFAKGAVSDDYDNDGWPDIFISNNGQPNRLYHNNQDGTFTDVAVAEGVTEVRDSFGAFFFDYDNDGWPDLYVSSFPRSNNLDPGDDQYGSLIADIAADRLGLPVVSEPARLFHNDHGHFVDVSVQTGVSKVDLSMGLNFGDLDNDGWPDFYLGTGQASLDALEPNRMFHNVGGVRFEDVTATGGFGHLQKGHGIAFADLRNNGQQDVITKIGGALPVDSFRNAVFLNPGTDHSWVTVKLVGTRSNRAAVGARVEVKLSNRSVFATVSSGGSFGATAYQRSFGLGDAQSIEAIDVRWPSGETQHFARPPLGEFLELTEGSPDVRIQLRPKVSL